jgi:hypothetical protein
MEQAVTISENVLSAPLHQLCFGLDPLLLLGLPLPVVGLCRARRARLVGAGVGGRRHGSAALLPAQGNLVPAVAFLPIQLPLAVAGLQGIERTLVKGRV